jgi:hypothetical protein
MASSNLREKLFDKVEAVNNRGVALGGLMQGFDNGKE